jgi:multidrug efflux pump subunit AcrA (membrane-fusion protein)
MFAQVELDVATVEGLVVPDSAVLETGEEQIVFVESIDASFVPRRVRLGVRGDGEVVVLQGLGEGERVAVHATFLLDSESRLAAAFAGSHASPAPATPPAAGTHAGHAP